MSMPYNRNGVMLHVTCGGAVGKLYTGFYHRLQSITGDSMNSLLLGTILTKRVCPKWSTPLRLRPLGDTVLFSQLDPKKSIESLFFCQSYLCTNVLTQHCLP